MKTPENKIEIKKTGKSSGKELRDGIYETVERQKYSAFDSDGNRIGAAVPTSNCSFKILIEKTP